MKTRRKIFKKFAWVLLGIMILETVLPAYAMALTSGPVQPEFQGFQQAGTSDMVDLFTGNFSYNIPIMDVGGYPINLSYSSDPGMDDEASWVGLGWSLNPGAINRTMRGLPDDFRGDKIQREMNLSDDVTVGVKPSANLEIFGKGRLGIGTGLIYNNKRGFEINFGLNIGMAPARGTKGTTAGLGFGFSPSSGLDLNANIGFSASLSEKVNGQLGLSNGINSRMGLQALTFQASTDVGFSQKLGTNIGTSSPLTFGPFSYTPTSLLPMQNTNVMLNVKLGGEFVGAHPNASINGFLTIQKLAYQKETQNTYGYCYLDATESENDLQDYNSELNGKFQQNAPFLPLSYGTYDLFNISGQGVGGQFRAVRNDMGIFRPAKEVNRGTGISIGAELGGGNAFHGGADVTATDTNNEKGIWPATSNGMKARMKFTSREGKVEPFYFKTSGEIVPNSNQILSAVGQFKPVRTDNKLDDLRLGNKFIEESSSGSSRTFTPIGGLIKNDERVKRNQVISYLTAEEAAHVGLEKNRLSYEHNTIAFGDCGTNQISSYSRKQSESPHHFSEMTVTQTDGSRYVYGLPVYNNLQKEVSFSINSSNILPGTLDQNDNSYGLVSYNPGTDNSIDNDKGDEHFFDSKSIPAYAHSFLLTGVLSADYVDRTGDGITDDDLGNAIRFNYTRKHGNYKWRIPVQANRARYHEGLKASSNDDKASYLYGEKEIWYVHSIESRTMLAQFYTSPRQDALGVENEDGGIGTGMEQMRLDSIKLYTKANLRDGATNATPIKTAIFEYGYDLCQGVPNGQSGKLTLKKVLFTYGKSQRGKLNAYQFDYKKAGFDYNIGLYDRWGFYKKNPNRYPPTHEYPYVLQGDQQAVTQQNAGAWNLNEITLPSGGKIEVTYEADDYAYVQNVRAGQMIGIRGFSNGVGSLSDDLYDGDRKPFRYVSVNIPDSIATVEEASERYLNQIDQVYYNCLVQLKGSSHERVSGYFEIDKSSGILLDTNVPGDVHRLLIPIKFVRDKRKNNISPITFTAVQKMRLELPELFYPGFNANNPVTAVIKSMVGLVNEIKNLSKGVVYNSMRKGWCNSVDTSSTASWIRLCNPNFKKLGGGSRVKKIKLTDEWQAFTGESGAEYGQTYDYRTLQKTHANVEEYISSGVASYEPGIGGEENLMKEGMPFTDPKVFLAPKSIYYGEGPIGESLFPSPVVGYSKVTVTDLANETLNLFRNQSGQTIHEFYTARDFPTIVKSTALNKERIRNKALARLFKLKGKDRLSASQGHTVEINDMHGKQKSQRIFDKDKALISSVVYKYKVENENAEAKRLFNEVDAINTRGEVAKATQGIEVDVWQEMMQEENRMNTAGVGANGDGFILAIFPGFVPSVHAQLQRELTQFRASVTTKLIKRNGILDHVIAEENGSSVTTTNVLRDSETGQVLLTRTTNEFDDPIFNFTYPAHWAYEGMGQAYQNIGMEFSDVNITDGIITSFDPSLFFEKGDEVFLSPNNLKLYVTDLDGTLFLLDRSGTAPSGSISNAKLKVIRSGLRNQASVAIGQVSTRENPINGNQELDLGTGQKILDASAVTFSEDWQVSCELSSSNPPSFTNTALNPYTRGMRGQWRPNATYAHYTNRVPVAFSANTSMHVRDNGQTADFTPFWTNSGTDQWSPSGIGSPKWPLSNLVTIYDDKGNELENEDALGIPSAAYFGYNKSLPIAVANNCRYREILFDGLEDYVFDNDCNTDDEYQRNLILYDPSWGIPILKEDISHSGRFSIQFPAGTHRDFYVNINNSCLALARTTSEQRVGQGETSAGSDSNPPEARQQELLRQSPPDNCFNYFYSPGSSPPVTVENKCCACLPILQPNQYDDFYFSTWVASDSSLLCGLPPLAGYTKIEFISSINPALTFKPEGPVIDGWQRIEGRISIPGHTSGLRIQLGNDTLNTSQQYYFDDIRFHPWRSNMQAYVYDPYSLRLMATLDQNNYASFYEYDDEGLLIRTKRETENGIVTLQEGRTVLKENNTE